MLWMNCKCCLQPQRVMQSLLNNTRRYFSYYRVAANAFEMAAKHGELRVFIVAGEVSGDTIASRLMASLRTLSPVPVNFSGVGGPMMSKQGLTSLFLMEDIAVMGIWELFSHLKSIREVSRMIPIYISTMELLKESFPELITIIHVAPNHHVQDYINGVLHKWPVPAILVAGGSPQAKYDAFSASKVALCTSGTVVTELQLARLPCVVAYRAHFLTEWFIQCKANVSYISLPNILLNSPVIPEALFQDCTPAKLHSMIKELICNNGLCNKQVVAAKEVLKLLSSSKDNMKFLAEEGLKCTSSICTPSMIAASAILFYKRTSESIL